MTIEETREYMKMMEDSDQYHFYGENIDEIPDDQVIDMYMTIMSFISDARTHDY